MRTKRQMKTSTEALGPHTSLVTCTRNAMRNDIRSVSSNNIGAWSSTIQHTHTPPSCRRPPQRRIGKGCSILVNRLGLLTVVRCTLHCTLSGRASAHARLLEIRRTAGLHGLHLVLYRHAHAVWPCHVTTHSRVLSASATSRAARYNHEQYRIHHEPQRRTCSRVGGGHRQDCRAAVAHRAAHYT